MFSTLFYNCLHKFMFLFIHFQGLCCIWHLNEHQPTLCFIKEIFLFEIKNHPVGSTTQNRLLGHCANSPPTTFYYSKHLHKGHPVGGTQNEQSNTHTPSTTTTHSQNRTNRPRKIQLAFSFYWTPPPALLMLFIYHWHLPRSLCVCVYAKRRTNACFVIIIIIMLWKLPFSCKGQGSDKSVVEVAKGRRWRVFFLLVVGHAKFSPFVFYAERKITYDLWCWISKYYNQKMCFCREFQTQFFQKQIEAYKKLGQPPLFCNFFLAISDWIYTLVLA